MKKDQKLLPFGRNWHLILGTYRHTYGSVSSGRELALSYVLFLKSLTKCCDQTGSANLVISTVNEISFYLDY